MRTRENSPIDLGAICLFPLVMIYVKGLTQGFIFSTGSKGINGKKRKKEKKEVQWDREKTEEDREKLGEEE